MELNDENLREKMKYKQIFNELAMSLFHAVEIVFLHQYFLDEPQQQVGFHLN